MTSPSIDSSSWFGVRSGGTLIGTVLSTWPTTPSGSASPTRVTGTSTTMVASESTDSRSMCT